MTAFQSDGPSACEYCNVPVDSPQSRWYEASSGRFMHSVDGQKIPCGATAGERAEKPLQEKIPDRVCRHDLAFVISWNWSGNPATLSIKCGSCGDEFNAE